MTQATADLERSTGHVAFIGPYEYFYGPDGDLYRSMTSSGHYVDVFGYRSGSRFESTPAGAERVIDEAISYWTSDDGRAYAAECNYTYAQPNLAF